MFDVFKSEISGYSTVLDLGCGRGDVLHAAGLVTKIDITGVDGHEPSIIEAKAVGYTHTIKSDIMTYLDSQETNSFDVVVAFDVIEHLEKSEGYRLIDEASRVASHKVILMTPNGFQHQSPSPDNPFQEHRSGWSPQELEAVGFSRFIGINGIKALRGEYSSPTIRPRKLGLLLSGMTNSYVRSRPEKAFQFIAIKDV